MKGMSLVTVVAIAALAGPAVSTIEAQSDEHPIVGMWTLNLEKSSFEPGSGPRSLNRFFGIDDEGFLVSIRATVTAVGGPTFALSRAKLDGSDYPVWTEGAVYNFIKTGDEPTGTVSFEEVDGRTLRITQKNAEGEVTPLSPNTWQVSSDGNTLTVTTSGTNANGVSVHNVEVFDRVIRN